MLAGGACFWGGAAFVTFGLGVAELVVELELDSDSYSLSLSWLLIVAAIVLSVGVVFTALEEAFLATIGFVGAVAAFGVAVDLALFLFIGGG